MDATVATILGILGAFMTLVSITIAVFTFYFNRKKETSDDGEFKGSLKTDIEYIKKGVDELKEDNRDIKSEVGDLRERVSSVESLANAAHKRLDRIEETAKIKLKA